MYDYLSKHGRSGFKIGDEVVVTRTSIEGEDGWEAYWDSRMDWFVGKRCVITYDYGDCGFYLVLLDTKGYSYGAISYSFPYFVLELADVKAVAKPKSNDYPHVCPRCGAPAYCGLFKVDCSKNCK